jgi:heme oxygenase
MQPPVSAAPTSLRDELRASTAAAHAALDQALMPAGVRWTRERYVAFLQGTLAVVSAAEPAVAAVLPDFASCHEPTRTKRLRDDLVALGVEALAPPSTAFPRLASAAAAWGVAYVLEGSRLGWQVVARQVAQALSLGDESLHYLRPAGVSAGARWTAFVTALDGFGAAATDTDRRVAAAWASHAFAAFEAAFRDEGLL